MKQVKGRAAAIAAAIRLNPEILRPYHYPEGEEPEHELLLNVSDEEAVAAAKILHSSGDWKIKYFKGAGWDAHYRYECGRGCSAANNDYDKTKRRAVLGALFCIEFQNERCRCN